MDEHFKVTCPGCENILIIRRRDGKLLEVREPILEDSTGDRFEDAFKKVKGRKDAVNAKVEQAKKREAERLEGADDFFKEALQRAKELKDDKPFNPMEYD